MGYQLCAEFQTYNINDKIGRDSQLSGIKFFEQMDLNSNN